MPQSAQKRDVSGLDKRHFGHLTATAYLLKRMAKDYQRIEKATIRPKAIYLYPPPFRPPSQPCPGCPDFTSKNRQSAAGAVRPGCRSSRHPFRRRNIPPARRGDERSGNGSPDRRQGYHFRISQIAIYLKGNCISVPNFFVSPRSQAVLDIFLVVIHNCHDGLRGKPAQ